MRRILVVLIAVLASMASLLIATAATPAGASTFSVTSVNMCGGAGTFQQALADANAHPGVDTIEIAAGLTIESWTCNSLPNPIHGYPLTATESLEIVGNGSTVTGGQVYINAAGQVNDPASCPEHTAGTRVASEAVGLLDVGTFDTDNTGLAVSVHDLNFSGMPSLFLVEKNASLTLTDSTADRTQALRDECTRPPIQSNDGDVTLRRVTLHDSSTPAIGVAEASSTTAVVTGLGHGSLVMDHVRMDHNYSGRAVRWNGPSALIVSSQFDESGGIWLDADRSEIVNSSWRSTRQNAVDRIASTASTLRVEASTFFWGQPVCERCLGPSLGFVTAGTGRFDLHSTAIGSGSDYPGAQPLLWGDTSAFTSDALTWVQPTGAQDAAAINAILPNALTAAPGLNSSFVQAVLQGGVSDVTPLLGTVVTPGVLIDAVTSATCTAPNDANTLINPIDSSCITTDVFGAPRWDSGDGSRNIGAVQNVDTPHLAVASIGDGEVTLQWNRPLATAPATITGYSIFHRPISGGAYTRVDLTGADTLSHVVTGLTDGVDEEFQVLAVLTSGDGPLSNAVHATPVGPIGTPVVTAVPGATDVRLFWTEPSPNGHTQPFQYFVVFRPVGAADWSDGPGHLAGRTTDIPELACATTYEFGVAVVAADGTAGPVIGTATASPTAACPEPQPEPGPGPSPLPPDVVVPKFTG